MGEDGSACMHGDAGLALGRGIDTISGSKMGYSLVDGGFGAMWAVF